MGLSYSSFFDSVDEPIRHLSGYRNRSSRFSFFGWRDEREQQMVVGGLSGVTTELAVLAGAHREAFAAAHAAVARVEEPSGPLYAGTFAEYVRERASGDAALALQLRNVVRKCAHCGKANGFTMAECNNCNTPFPADHPRTHTENVFMGFVYGIARTDAFPLSISIRKQTPELLVFDDPLALTPCHLNVIPTRSWVPDWRILLRNPTEGLQLVNTLEEAAWSCVASQFLSDATWCKKMLKTGRPAYPESLRHHIVCGCNFPPSQFQLHIQYFLLPWIPGQYKMMMDGHHLPAGRWFPLEYIKRVLALNDPMAVTMDTPLSDIFDK